MDFSPEHLVTRMMMDLIWKRVVLDKIIERIIDYEGGEALELLSNKAVGAQSVGAVKARLDGTLSCLIW